MTAIETLNKEYLDLYGDCLKTYVELPATSTFNDIKKQVSTNTTIGYQHKIKVGDRFIIAERKYTWQGRCAKTAYLHIWHVTGFEGNFRVITHWREQKDGNFKTI